jgi:hypothetical protein
MITATTQQSSIKASQDATEQLQIYKDVAESVAQITSALRAERLVRKRGKEYDRVVPAYFWAISQVLTNLAAVMTLGAPAVWLIGDSAPYGVYIDTPSLISRLAEQIGFVTEKDVALRRRGQRWTRNSSRRDVDLSERLLLLRRK